MIGILCSFGILVAVLLATAIVYFLALSFVIFLWGIADKYKKTKKNNLNHKKRKRKRPKRKTKKNSK